MQAHYQKGLVFAKKYNQLLEGFHRLQKYNHSRAAHYFQYILAREWGRLRRVDGRSREKAYANLPPGVVILPSGTEHDTRHRMKRKLGNIDRADDATSRLLAKRISSTFSTKTKRPRFVTKKDHKKQEETVTAQPSQLQLQQVVLSWALARRLDPHFFEQAIEHLQWYAGTLESAHACIEKVKLDAVETFLKKSNPWEFRECTRRC